MNAVTTTLEVEVGASPFREVVGWFVPEGMTCAWLVENAPDLVTREPVHLVVLIGGEEVPATMWRMVKPKAGAAVAVLVVPKDDDAFAFATTALQISSVLVGFVNPLAGLGLAVGGGLILQAFRPKPGAPGSQPEAGLTSSPDNSAGSSINQLRPDAQIPAAPGEHLVSLALLAPIYIDIVGDKEVAFILAGLQGPHDLDDLKINDAAIADFSDAVTFNIDNGLSGNLPKLTIYDRIVIQEPVNERFELFDTKPDAAVTVNKYRELVDQTDPTTSRPRKKIRTSGDSPDEIWLHCVMGEGFKSVVGTDPVGTAFTIELKLKGSDTWRKLPYARMITILGIERPFPFYVRLLFKADPGGIPTNIGEPWDEMLSSAPQPPSTVGDDGGNQDWIADPYFDNTIDDQALHVAEFGDGLEIYLDPDDATNPWAKGEYEIRIDKGYAITQNNIQTTLQGQAQYHNLFDSAGTLILGAANSATNTIVANLDWLRLASVWNEPAMTARNMAYVEMRIEAIQVDRLTALARGYTNVFNGADWNAVALTKDPAAWYRRSLIDTFHAEPLPEALLDDTSLQAWSVDNQAKGYEFNAVIEGGTTVEDMLRFTAIAGFAKTLRSDRWGVWLDKDRSAEVPTMVLTPENTNGLQVEKELENIPDALRVTFRDRENGYREDEVLIDNTGSVVDSGSIVESIDGARIGKTTLAENKIWGRRLLLERQERAALMGLTVPARSLHAKRGNMIGASHDVLAKTFSFAVVEDVFDDGAGNATALRLNNRLRLSEAATEDIFAVADVFDVADVFEVSQPFGVAVELTDGTVRIEQIDEITDSEIVTFSTPFVKPATLDKGAWIGSGPLGTETRRLIIVDMRPGDDDTARLVLVDEAPTIH